MKINCCYHDDSTASLHIYEDHFFCYGCLATGPLSILGNKIPFLRSSFKQGKPEDIDKALERINKLPTKIIRGLELPYDSRGYYIVYPNAKYYILRKWEDKEDSKYMGPYGHRKPLFVSGLLGGSNLFLIEGQINALTAYLSKKFSGFTLDNDIVSPGAATDFLKPSIMEYCLQYDKICLIVDKDAAGVAAGLQLRDKLIKRNKQVVLHAMEKDLNDLLVEQGPERVKEEIKNALKMFEMQQGKTLQSAGE